MCGIAGVFDPRATPAAATLEAMNDCIDHRGPDESGLYRDGPVGFAHRRLSIIDLQTGRQPIFNEDGTVAVIFNGELYNYKSLRESLVDAGHRFTTETDTETLVHAYEEYGIEFLDHLEGMFAFALWDGERERLVLARDPMGIKPLVLADDGERIAFGSELPSVLAAGIDHGGLDETALAQYFALGHVPAPRTAFENVTKLKPGEFAVVSDGDVRREQFYRFSVSSRAPPFEAASRRLRSLLEDAVRERLQSDVPLGAFLSGGIDSSVLVGIMATLSDEPVNTFTIGFDQSHFDESWAAREVAEYHGTDHHEFTMSPDDVQELIPEVLGRLGEPFADQSLLPSYLVSRESSRHLKVALSGDGADELFAGYDKYLVEFYSSYYRALPRSFRSVIDAAVNALPASRGDKYSELLYQAQWFVNRSTPPEVSERHFELMRILDERTADAFDGVDPFAAGQRDLSIQHANLDTGDDSRDALTRIQAVDARYSLPNQMLTKMDLASMYNSLEVRVPFLDTEVVEYTLSLPTDYKITHRNRKRILTHACEDLLPEPILNRDKQGFEMPIGEWLRTDLADDFLEMLETADLGVLNDDAVRAIFEEHAAGRREHGKFLWSVYVFKQWANRMVEQGVLEPSRVRAKR